MAVEVEGSDASAALSAENPALTEPTSPQPLLGDATLNELIRLANEQYVRAQQSLQKGDWAGYGAEMAELEATLEQLIAISGIDINAIEESAGSPAAEADTSVPQATEEATEEETPSE